MSESKVQTRPENGSTKNHRKIPSLAQRAAAMADGPVPLTVAVTRALEPRAS